MLELIGAILFVVIMSALCSCFEAAIFSLSPMKARQLADKSQNGKMVFKIRDQPARPISVIVILNNLFNICGTFVIASLAVTVLSPFYQAWLPFALTALVIVFSEIVPKTVGERFCKPITCFIARPLSWITFLMTPLVVSIEWMVCLFIGKSKRSITSEKEIRALAKIGHQEGVIDEDEKTMIGRVFELDDQMAVDIMTPRTALSWVKASATVGEVQKTVAYSEHSRIVAVGETIDDVKGILLKSTMLKMLTDNVHPCNKIEEYLTSVKLCKEDTPADELLEYFKESKVHLAVVVDEFGGVTGVVTIEDVIEVLTGEIMDETDLCMDLRQMARQQAHNRLNHTLPISTESLAPSRVDQPSP